LLYVVHGTLVILAYFASNRKAPAKNSSPAQLASAIRFDQRIAAISLFTDASANALVAISPASSEPLFVFLTSLNALTSGGHPALQSLGALSLRAMGKGNEVGLVFGALGLMNALSHIIAVCLAVSPQGRVVDYVCIVFTARHIRCNLWGNSCDFP